MTYNYKNVISYNRLRFFIMASLLFFSYQSYAQNSFSGTVTDDQGNPIPGVAVLIKGTTQGTTTDFDGNYTINAEADQTLVFQSIGFAPQEILLSDESTINITLLEDTELLDEIIVTGYTTQTRKSITGAVAVVDVGDLESLPEQSALGRLQGRVTGVQIGKNGGPGGTPLVRIRGISNVSTSTDPLYVIDGVQTADSNVFNLINPSDIESIQVLKDASAAAIYGTRANNGVIIVTTKTGKGTGDGVRFNLNLSTTIQNARSEAFPEFLSPKQYADWIWTRTKNAGNTPNHPLYGSGASPVLPKYLTGSGGAESVDLETYALVAGGDNNPIRLANQTGTDWMNEIFQTGIMNNADFSVSQSTDKSNFYISTSYSSNEGILKHTSFDRYSIRVNSEFKVSDKLTIGESVMAGFGERRGQSGTQQEGGAVMQAHRIMPIIPVYDVKGNYAGTKGGSLGNGSNPVAALYRDRDDVGKDIRVLANVFAEYALMDQLYFKTSYSLNYNSGTSVDIKRKRLEDQEQDSQNRLTNWNGILSEATFTNMLRYTYTTGDHVIKPVVGMEFIENSWRSFNAYRDGFDSEKVDYMYLNAGNAGNQFNGGEASEDALFSAFGKLDYAYAESLFLSASLRVDQSSKYTKENRTGYFPSFGASYNVADGTIKGLSNLKIRAAWGQTGNSRTDGAYPTYSTYGLNATTNNYSIDGAITSVNTGYASANDGNPNLKWETVETTDFAVQGTISDKFNFEIGLYERKTEDMLVQVPRPATAGLATNPYLNIGNMSNSGVELALDYSTKLGEIDLTAGFNFSTNKNKVLSISSNPKDEIVGASLRQSTVSLIKQGHPVGFFYGYDIVGFYDTEADVKKWGQSNGAVGGFKYRDVDGDGKITPDDRTEIGSPHPDYFFGFNLGMNYKNFTFNFFVDGQGGNEIYDFKKYFTDFHFFPGTVKTTVLDTWTTSNQNATLPYASDNVSNQEIPSSYYIEDGSFIRIRNIQIGYDFPRSITQKMGVSTLRMNFQIDNAYIFTNYSGMDPEVNVFSNDNRDKVNQNLGIDRGVYPNPRSFIVGLNIGI